MGTAQLVFAGDCGDCDVIGSALNTESISEKNVTIGWIQIESIGLVGFEFEARRATIGGIQISEGLRLVGFIIPFRK
jgi:hypothetical protein